MPVNPILPQVKQPNPAQQLIDVNASKSLAKQNTIQLTPQQIEAVNAKARLLAAQAQGAAAAISEVARKKIADYMAAHPGVTELEASHILFPTTGTIGGVPAGTVSTGKFTDADKLALSKDANIIAQDWPELKPTPKVIVQTDAIGALDIGWKGQSHDQSVATDASGKLSAQSAAQLLSIINGQKAMISSRYDSLIKNGVFVGTDAQFKAYQYDVNTLNSNVNKYNNSINQLNANQTQAQKDFLKNNTLLGDGTYISNSDFNALNQTQQQIAKTQGLTALRTYVNLVNQSQQSTYQEQVDAQQRFIKTMSPYATIYQGPFISTLQGPFIGTDGKITAGQKVITAGNTVYNLIAYRLDHPTVNDKNYLTANGFDKSAVDNADAAIQSIQNVLIDKNFSSPYVAALNNAIDNAGYFTEAQRQQILNANLVSIGGQLSYSDKKTGVAVSPNQELNLKWNALTSDQKTNIMSLYQSDAYKSNLFSESEHQRELGILQGGLIAQIASAGITGITSPVAKQMSGQPVSKMEWTTAGVTTLADVLMLGGGELIGGIGTVGSRIASALGSGAGGYFLTTGLKDQIPNLAKMSKSDLIDSIIIDALLAVGTGLGAKGTFGKVEPTQQSLGGRVTVDKSGSPIITGAIRDVSNAGLPARTIVTLKALPEVSLDKLNNALERINILADDVMSGRASEATKMAFNTSVSVVKNGISDLGKGIKVSYESSIQKLNNGMENINVLADKVMSGDLSNATINGIKDTSLLMKQQLINIGQLSGQGYEKGIQKLNDSLDNINILSDKVMSGDLSVATKNKLIQSLNVVKDGFTSISKSTSSGYETTIQKLNDRLEVINKIADDVMSGKASNTTKAQLSNVISTIKQDSANVSKSIGSGYESVVQSVNSKLDNLNNLADVVMSGNASNSIKEAFIKSGRELQNTISVVKTEVPNVYETTIQKLNNTLENINNLSDSIMASNLDKGSILHLDYLKDISRDLKTDFATELKLAELERVLKGKLSEIKQRLQLNKITVMDAEIEINNLRQSSEWKQYKSILQDLSAQFLDRMSRYYTYRIGALDGTIESIARKLFLGDEIARMDLSNTVKWSVASGNMALLNGKIEQLKLQANNLPLSLREVTLKELDEVKSTVESLSEKGSPNEEISKNIALEENDLGISRDKRNNTTNPDRKKVLDDHIQELQKSIERKKTQLAERLKDPFKEIQWTRFVAPEESERSKLAVTETKEIDITKEEMPNKSGTPIPIRNIEPKSKTKGGSPRYSGVLSTSEDESRSVDAISTLVFNPNTNQYENIERRLSSVPDFKLVDETSTKIRPNIEVAPMQEIKPLQANQTQTLVQPETETKPKPDVQPEPLVVPITDVKTQTDENKKKGLVILTRSEEQRNKADQKFQDFSGSLVFRWGFGWWALKAPYKTSKDIAFFRKPPPNAIIMKDAKSIYQTIQQVTGKPPSSELIIPIGIQTVYVRKVPLKPGAKGAVTLKMNRAAKKGKKTGMVRIISG